MLGGMTARASDYQWLEDRFPDLAEAYCFTLIKDPEPSGALTRFAARPEPRVTGLNDLVRAAFDLHGRRADGDYELLLGATQVGEWTLIVEPNGFLGVDSASAVRAAHDTVLVSHFLNINSRQDFCFVDRGSLRLTFDPGFPDDRAGEDADRLTSVMIASGFDLSGEENLSDASGPAAFALAANLTGVTITASLLENATFQCGACDQP